MKALLSKIKRQYFNKFKFNIFIPQIGQNIHVTNQTEPDRIKKKKRWKLN